MDEQTAQGLGLVEVAQSDLEQLQQGEEAGDDDQRVLGRVHQLCEIDLPGAQQREDVPALFGHADQRQMDVVDGHGRRGVVALEHGGEDAGQLGRADAQLQGRQHVLELGLETDVARRPDRPGRHRLGEVSGHGFVRLVLQKAGEEQVPGLEQFEVEHLLALLVRQQPRGFEVEQGGRDEEELRDLGEVRLVLEFGGVGDELIGDLGQCDLGDVEPSLRDQAQQQVEGAGEVLQLHLEPLRGLFAGRCGLLAGRRSIGGRCRLPT